MNTFERGRMTGTGVWIKDVDYRDYARGRRLPLGVSIITTVLLSLGLWAGIWFAMTAAVSAWISPWL